jgi:hypothetical protein
MLIAVLASQTLICVLRKDDVGSQCEEFLRGLLPDHVRTHG